MKFDVRSRIAAMMLAITILGASACKQKDDPAPANGSLKMQFSNMVGNEAMVLNTGKYISAIGDSFSVTIYNYYISNIVLHTADGKTYTEQESYHLIEQEHPETRTFTLANVPPGDYTSVTFMIGVDSLRNSTGAQTGELDPTRGMIWDWNTGYIMAKMEGIANTSVNPGKGFAMHIAGYKGSYNVLKTVTLNFPSKATVGAKTPNVHIFSDAAEWLKAPQTISFADYSDVNAEGKRAREIADNYEDMFTVDHVDN